MQAIRETCAALWDQLNPSEPSPHFLIKFFATAIVLFLIAYMIGQA